MSLDDVVDWKCLHLVELFTMSLNSRNGKWSALLGGLKLHVPLLPASSAHACHVLPEASILSRMFGAESCPQQFPSPEIPRVLAPASAI